MNHYPTNVQDFKEEMRHTYDKIVNVIDRESSILREALINRNNYI